MELNGKKVTVITQSQMLKGLEAKRPMMVFGKSGSGKTALAIKYAIEHKLIPLFVDLAGKLPEAVAGIPKVLEGTPFYITVFDQELEHFFAVEGEGYLLIFDEINQGTPETFNTMYQIAHPDPEQRRWGSHKIGKCQIVAMGNLNDGSDGTVYLNDLPTPLLNRFFVFELVDSNKETTAYLKEKYKNIPQVAKYIRVLLENSISPRDIDLCLDILQYEHDAMFLEAKLGEALANKILQMQKDVKTLDPAEMIKNAKAVYTQFKEDGEVRCGARMITTERELKEELSAYLSEEEITAVMKGDE